ncbi:zeta toxin family protein [Thermithiobacillus plumbiphilus]|uniref:Zeta toxin family protein n=1 Tax=Thermithiobacillus plumbiphilus TaxID=1729899 RepID=A0ABU9D5I1_9PROT
MGRQQGLDLRPQCIIQQGLGHDTLLLIAAGLSPFAPEAAAVKAGRLMLKEIDECVAREENFSFETTLAGLAYVRHIEQWRKQGYHIILFFLSLPSAELAIARVAERVKQGGHDIPERTIRRRFAAGLRNFEQHYRVIVDAWVLYDNAGDEPAMVEWGENE